VHCPLNSHTLLASPHTEGLGTVPLGMAGRPCGCAPSRLDDQGKRGALEGGEDYVDRQHKGGGCPRAARMVLTIVRGACAGMRTHAHQVAPRDEPPRAHAELQRERASNCRYACAHERDACMRSEMYVHESSNRPRVLVWDGVGRTHACMFLRCRLAIVNGGLVEWSSWLRAVRWWFSSVELRVRR
jgi:hypothetical protein